MTSINYVKQTSHFVFGLIILLFCLPCPVAAYADGEDELAWIRTTEDQEQFYYRWADFADKRYWNNEKLLATFDNPLLEKIVASNRIVTFVTELVGFFNDTWNEDVVHRHKKALERLEGSNQCRLQSTEISGSPG